MENYDRSLSVKTKHGTFVGVRDEKYGTVTFKGVRFGVAERWQPARFPDNTEIDVIPAREYGPSPIQSGEAWGTIMPAGTSEDCLNLNIYAHDLEKNGKSVLVWIFPGMQIIGSNLGYDDDPGHCHESYEGAAFAARNEDIIVVVPNYRVGVFGSSCLDVMPDYSEKYKYAANLTRLDIVHALRWVHEHIADFGGDPDKVTVAGQSAGSNNITAMFHMDEAQGLFRRAICESSNMMDISCMTLDDARTVSREYFRLLGVRSIEEALTKSAAELLRAQDEMNERSVDGSSAFANIQSKSFSPVLDNVTLRESYWQEFMTGKCRDVELMVGTTEGEYDQQFARWENDPDRCRLAREFVISQNWGKLDPERGTNPEITDEVVANYPERSEFDAYRDLKIDSYVRAAGFGYASVFSRFSKAYVYYIKYNPLAGHGRLRAPHGTEIPLIFLNDYKCDAPQKLKELFSDTWAGFIRSGVPGCPALGAEWKPFDMENYWTMLLDEKSELVPGVHMKDIECIMPAMHEYKTVPEFAALWKK